MSKSIVRSPGGLLKNSAVGALVALISYVVLQCPVALLIHCEVVGIEVLYPVVCVTAALSSFLGCAVSVMRGGEGGVLSASAVTMVFLAVTVMVGALSGEVGMVGAGLIGVGSAMAVGGLIAAVLPALVGRGWRWGKGRGKRSKRR